MLFRSVGMSENRSGSCLCGDIRFNVPATPVLQVLCHCTDCQTISGSASYCAYIVPLDSVVLQQGEPEHYDVIADSGRRNSRRFCGNCGSRLWAELEMGTASVNGMCLDDRDHFQPSYNHRLGSAPGWCQINNELEELPAG